MTLRMEKRGDVREVFHFERRVAVVVAHPSVLEVRLYRAGESLRRETYDLPRGENEGTELVWLVRRWVDERHAGVRAFAEERRAL